MHKCFLFSTALSTLVTYYLFDNSHPDKCNVLSHCGFDLHFPDDYWCWASTPVSVDHLYYFFGKNIYLGPLLIFNRFLVFVFFFTLSCIKSLYILDTNPLSEIFSSIFSHSAGCIYILLIVCLPVKKLFSLMQSYLLVLLLLPLPERIYPRI